MPDAMHSASGFDRIEVVMGVARETVAFAQDMGFISCFTPVRSPESNGMAEAFVKTLKRDYVYVHDRPDAKTVMLQLHQWFEDYNEHHPYKGLKMKSPRQFIRSQLLTASVRFNRGNSS